MHGQRRVICAHITSTQESCGYAVPRYELVEERQTYEKYAGQFTTDQIQEKIANQTASIDGLSIT